MSEYRTFVVPYDFSAHARAALDAALDLGRRLGADLHLVHVIQPPAYAYGYGAYGGIAAAAPVDLEQLRESAAAALREVVKAVENPPGKLEAHVVSGSIVAEALREKAEQLGADLIVMGTHGRTGLAHVFLGSVAERTLRRAPCGVLTVQAPEEDDTAA